MTAGEELPEQVRAVVEDCGYTSVWDIFSDELQYLFHLPEFPLLYAADGIAWIRAGYEFKEASALEQVKKSQVPILFLHGSEDKRHQVVRLEMFEVVDFADHVILGVILLESDFLDFVRCGFFRFGSGIESCRIHCAQQSAGAAETDSKPFVVHGNSFVSLFGFRHFRRRYPIR